jgi:hypothetical protein
MVGSVALQRECSSGASLLRLAKALVNAAVGRVGMAITHREVESGPRGDHLARRLEVHP